jgi:hypothetical protein
MTKNKQVMLNGAANALYQLTDCMLALQAGKKREPMDINRTSMGILLCAAKIKRLIKEEGK